MLGFAAFRVVRLVPFLSLAVVMFSPRWLPEAWARSVPGSERRMAAGGRFQLVALAIASLVVAAASAAYAIVQQQCIHIRGGWLPDEGAAAFIAENGLEGRIVTGFTYGEYAIWHFAPELRVSMDGRRETVYSEQTLRKHAVLEDDDTPEAVRVLGELTADYVWLPRSRPVIPRLRGAGWIPIFEGPVSVLYAREPGNYAQPGPMSEGPRCFPGP
jgi:hypothetical protein